MKKGHGMQDGKGMQENQKQGDGNEQGEPPKPKTRGVPGTWGSPPQVPEGEFSVSADIPGFGMFNGPVTIFNWIRHNIAEHGPMDEPGPEPSREPGPEPGPDGGQPFPPDMKDLMKGMPGEYSERWRHGDMDWPGGK